MAKTNAIKKAYTLKLGIDHRYNSQVTVHADSLEDAFDQILFLAETKQIVERPAPWAPRIDKK